MKKISLVLTLVLFAAGFALAQRTVVGMVTDQEGEPLIGASVLVKGTTAGTVSDIDGKYSVAVPAGANVLVISYTGYESQEIELGTSNVVNVSLVEGVTLETAVVTALNIQRDEKALGFAVQEVSAENLRLNNETNFINSLSGKVAGVQVISGSSASLGGSAKIRIRGVNGLTSGDPLFVVDGTPISNQNFSNVMEQSVGVSGSDYGNLANDINPDDIDKVSVLKGPAATALYGERAKNGVVMITTKKGTKGRKGFGVTASTSVTADRVYVLPEYQNEYAGGYEQAFIEYVDPVDGQTYNTLDYSADESWGPRMDGTPYRPYYSWFEGPDYGKTIPLSPNPDNIRDFFETGLTNTNTVSVDGGGDKTSFRFSFTNLNQSGVLPNSRLDRNSASINAAHSIMNNLTLSVSANFINTKGRARPELGYGGVANPVNSFNQWFQRQLDMERLREYKNPDGTFNSWNIRSPSNPRPLYWDSPFYSVYENYNTDERDRYFGNVGLNYALTENFSISGAVRRDNFAQRIEERVGSGGLNDPFYSEKAATGREDNYEIIANYNNSFGNISLDVNLGGNIRKNTFHQNYVASSGGLTAPNLFNVGASVDRPTTTSEVREKTVRSVFGSANLGFFNTAYVGVSLRNDWSSALPDDNNNYLYPSFSGSFVFSELMKSSIISFGKIYGSLAQVGADLDPYLTNVVYDFGFAPYGSNSVFTTPNLLPNSDLKQTLSNAWEAGIDLRLFKDRLGIDFIYYNNQTKDDILRVQVSGTTGYEEALVNAGKTTSKGFEITLYGTPVKSREFSWDISLNMAQNRSKVEELYEDLTNYKLADGIGASRWGGFTVNATVGEQWGMARGRGYTYDESGNIIINSSGAFVVTSNKDLGSILPDYTGGVFNTFRYKGLELRASVDFQVGGQFFSTTRMFNAYSGLGEETVGNNDLGNPLRDPLRDKSGNVIGASSALASEVGPQSGGIRVDGVSESGEALSVYVDPVTYYGRMFGLHERWMYDASFVKLRELNLGYNLPTKWLGSTAIRSLKFSIIGRNLWLIDSKVDGIDPSEILPGANNIIYEETAGLPGVRSFGAMLTVGF